MESTFDIEGDDAMSCHKSGGKPQVTRVESSYHEGIIGHSHWRVSGALFGKSEYCIKRNACDLQESGL